MRRIPLTLIALLPVTGLAETLDFEDLACTGPSTLDISDVTGNPFEYRSGDYVITNPSTTNGFFRFCDGQPGFTGSTAIFNNTPRADNIVERADGASFSFTSIDVAELNGPSAVPVIFIGTTTTGAQITKTHFTDGIYPSTETVTFDPSRGWSDVVSVRWEQSAPYHQFDNIVVGGTGGPSLTVAGSCPGLLTIDIQGLTPGGRFAAVRSTSPGSAAIPGGGCAGVLLGLDSPRLVGFFPSGTGDQSFMPSISPGACGDYIQIVDLDTCATSPLAQF